MNYGITRMVIGGESEFIPIPKSEFEQVRNSKNVLIEALRIEEKFELLLENFIEYETDLMDISNRFMIYRSRNYHWFQEKQNLINRRILNLLSACRLYQDQTPHHLNKIFGKGSKQNSIVSEKMSEMYDNHFSYRVMEAYRNYTQHRGFPIHYITLHSKRLEGDKSDQLKFAVTPRIKIEKLKEDKKFKKKILKEVEDQEVLDFKPLIRGYIGCFGEVQTKVRDILKNDLEESENYIDNIVSRFEDEFGSETELAGISVVAKKDRKVDKSISIELKKVNQRRKELAKKNRTLSNLDTRYSTSEIIKN